MTHTRKDVVEALAAVYREIIAFRREHPDFDFNDPEAIPPDDVAPQEARKRPQDAPGGRRKRPEARP